MEKRNSSDKKIPMDGEVAGRETKWEVNEFHDSEKRMLVPVLNDRYACLNSEGHRHGDGSNKNLDQSVSFSSLQPNVNPILGENLSTLAAGKQANEFVNMEKKKFLPALDQLRLCGRRGYLGEKGHRHLTKEGRVEPSTEPYQKVNAFVNFQKELFHSVLEKQKMRIHRASYSNSDSVYGGRKTQETTKRKKNTEVWGFSRGEQLKFVNSLKESKLKTEKARGGVSGVSHWPQALAPQQTSSPNMCGRRVRLPPLQIPNTTRQNAGKKREISETEKDKPQGVNTVRDSDGRIARRTMNDQTPLDHLEVLHGSE